MSLRFPAFHRGAALLLLLVNTVPKKYAHSFHFPSCASSRSGTYKQTRAASLLPSVFRFDATRNIPSTFPQSALAFAASSDCINNAINTRNFIGVGIVDTAVTSNRFLHTRRTTQIHGVAMRTSVSSSVDITNETKSGKIPIVILGGFLGAGKTTALKRLLENTEGIKVGTIVNDVASVNIDAKLLSNPMSLGGGSGEGKSGTIGKGSVEGTVELQNGCACCSLSDELLTSVSDLMEGRDLDVIVVELSGVADPASVRQNWDQAVADKHPATQSANLDRIVTVVDSHTFGTDWMTWDTAGKRSWAEEGDECAGSRQIPELLAEQVESADVIILNKIDLSDGEQLETAKLVVRSLNKNAELFETKFGELSPTQIIGSIAKSMKETNAGHGHDHHDERDCADPGCSDTSHSHAHEHSSSAESTSHDHDHQSCEPNCNDPSHSHSHAHDEACADPGCSDSSHSHSHNHDEGCGDPICNDSSHSHSHEHKSTTTANLGISNFVYKKSRPFDPRKLQRLLMTWPIPVMEELKLADLELEMEKQEDSKDKSPFVGVLRSKGFAWVAPSILKGAYNDLDRHDTVLYWSHAGKHFGLRESGSWWASIGKEAMKELFQGNMDEYERIIEEDFVSGEWGDRRQELVFIGANLDEKSITDSLDSCLCTDEQMVEYKQAILDAIAEYYESK